MSAKRTVWATIGRVLWAILSTVLKVAAKLGSRWARRKLDDHAAEHEGSRLGRALRTRTRRR